jgi:phage/plasmid-like protein (TIGR03299 family)
MQADGHHFITRDSDNRILSHCGDDYIPIQNEDIFKFFKKFTEAGHMTMDTAGSLRDGAEIWGLAKIAADFKLAGGDEVKGYLLINQPHVAGKAMTIKFTPIRVVCNNTLTMALADGGAAFRMPHIKEFDTSVQSAAEEALGLSERRVKEFQEQAEFLASKQFKSESLMNYIAELYQPSILVEKAKAANDDFIIQEHFNKTSELVLSSVDLSPGASMKSAKGTWWGALNGATYVEDHQRRSTAVGNSLHSAWFGAAANRKAKALNKALEYAKAA